MWEILKWKWKDEQEEMEWGWNDCMKEKIRYLPAVESSSGQNPSHFIW